MMIEDYGDGWCDGDDADVVRNGKHRSLLFEGGERHEGDGNGV